MMDGIKYYPILCESKESDKGEGANILKKD